MLAELLNFKDHHELDGDIFAEIAGTLNAVGCCHDGDDHKSTPPMMYPEWIRCAVAKRNRDRDTALARVETLREALVTVANVGSGHAQQTALDALRKDDE